jgi:hypothetical protein
MKRVWKYALSTSGKTQTLLMPRGAEPLTFCVSDSMLFVYVLAEEHAEIEAAYFVVVNTGTQVPDRGAVYVGTAELGGYVFHLFQLTAMDPVSTNG